MVNPQFLKVGAICSLLSAVTTAALMYGPDAPAVSDFDATQALHENSLYLYKKWVLFFHPQFAFIAALALASVLYRKSTALTCIGIFYLAVWAITEMGQQAYTIDALNQTWRPAYLAAEGAEKEIWYTMIKGFGGLNDSQYFLLLFGFGIGSLLLGLALLKEQSLGRLIGAVTAMIGLMSLLAFANYYIDAFSSSGFIGFWYNWFYGPLQVGVRLLLGLWLFLRLKDSTKSLENNTL